MMMRMFEAFNTAVDLWQSNNSKKAVKNINKKRFSLMIHKMFQPKSPSTSHHTEKYVLRSDSKRDLFFINQKFKVMHVNFDADGSHHTTWNILSKRFSRQRMLL